MASKTPYRVANGPAKLGTYSQAVQCGDLLFVTMQTGRDLRTGDVAPGLAEQTQRMLTSIEEILAAAGRTPADIVKVSLFMTDIKDFKAIDDMYREWLPDQEVACYPARTALQAAALPAGVRVAMDVVATI